MDFCLLRKNMGKNVSSKYGQKLLDSTKKSTTDAIKTAWKRGILKTAEATGDLIDNKIADKTQVFLKSLKSHKIMNQKHQKKDKYLQKKDNKLLMN